MRKWKRLLLIVSALLVVCLLITIIFLSTIVKYLIEKHSEEYTGRKISIENLHINLFSGNIRADNLKISEPKSSQSFISCQEIDADIIVHKLFSGQYEITRLLLVRPNINIIQRGKHYNFDDLIKRFNKPSTPSPKNAPPTRYRIQNMKVDAAQVRYTNTNPLTKVAVENWNIRIPDISWNSAAYQILTSLSLASGGRLDADIRLNTRSEVYSVKYDLEEFDIRVLYPYLKDYLKVKTLDGQISAQMSVTGSLRQPEDIAASGNMGAKGFSMVDNTGEKLVALESQNVLVDTINTKSNFYNFKSITLGRPYLKFAMYDDGYNFQRIMTSPAASSTDTAAVAYANLFVMISDYVQSIMKNYETSNYKAAQIKVEGGHMIFTDYTHGDKFHYDLDSVNMLSDRVSSSEKRISVEMNSLLNRSGRMKGSLSVDPKDFGNMSMDCIVTGLLISDFNPYSKYYVATPFLNGALTYTNNTVILRRKLSSKNRLEVVKIEAGKKVKNKTAMNLPVRLAVSLLKDVHGNIHLDIPVSGSLDDPKFKWGQIVWQVLKNIIEKAATAPFRFFANAFGGKEEDYKQVEFDFLQGGVQDPQQKTLDNLAHVMSQKSDLNLQLVQVASRQDEAEGLALLLAKKQYLGLGSADTLDHLAKARIDSVADKDSLFNAFVNAKLNGQGSLMSIQEKCMQFLGKAQLDTLVGNLMENRKQAVISYLTIQKGLNPSRLMVSDAREDPLSRGNKPKFLINIGVKE